jgi:hypothetical protein
LLFLLLPLLNINFLKVLTSVYILVEGNLRNVSEEAVEQQPRKQKATNNSNRRVKSFFLNLFISSSPFAFLPMELFPGAGAERRWTALGVRAKAKKGQKRKSLFDTNPK